MNWYTSDLHLGHVAIIGMQNRPFANVEQMNNTIISNINSIVTPNDKLFILGDCSLHISLEETIRLLDRIRCKNKYLIKGNHDKDGYPEGYFKEIRDYMELEDHNHWWILEHYPLLSWRHQGRGYIHLHGHQHNSPEYNINNKNIGILRYDVGMDANNFMPVNAKQIIEFFGEDNLQNPFKDHHNKDRDILTEITKEQQELFEKLMKLRRFLNSKSIYNVSQSQLNGLVRQESAMTDYYNSLQMRIEDLRKG